MKVGIIGLRIPSGISGLCLQGDESFEIAGYVDPAPAGLANLTEKGISADTAYSIPRKGSTF